jgi:thiamine-phosphate pyrophosphorylase
LKKNVSGIYAITPDIPDTDELINIVGCALRGGIKLFQYRNKSADKKLKVEQADQLLKLIRDYGGALIINDDLSVLETVDADGLHVGKDDTGVEMARKAITKEKILGVSCYADVDRAVRSERAGADYVAFGSMFKTTSKVRADAASLQLLTEARNFCRVPFVAIGGINSGNLREVVLAGADSAAIIHGIFGASDICREARLCGEIFANVLKAKKI